ncbi:MAG: type III polyketide synthase [Leadbetterella sp.]
MTYINKISTAIPPYKHSQSRIYEFMQSQTEFSDAQKRGIKLMYGLSGIETRYSVLNDFSDTDPEFFAEKSSRTIQERMKLYKENAILLANQAILGLNIDLSKITHLITISCTGMSAPGLDVDLVNSLDLEPTISRTSVNFMGCYAAIHAFKHADAIVSADKNARVVVVSVELCTLHFQNENKTDFITSNLLFGDGGAAALISSQKEGFEIKGFHSRIYRDINESMAWDISEKGFLMKLTQDVPAIIQENIRGFVEDALVKVNWDKTAVKYLIHPGGRKILDVVIERLGLQKSDIDESYSILRDFGNMSSATIMYILGRLKPQSKKPILMAGFGPGITIESMLLQAL